MTRILQRFDIRTIDGSPVVNFPDWVKTLSKEEQTRFEEARTRQHRHRQEVIDRGDMIITENGYEWRDPAAAEKNKPSDEIWLEYWDRWLKECKIEFNNRWEEIK